MSDENDTFDNTSLLTDDYPLIAYTVQFWTYLIVLVPSIVCSLFVLYHLLSNRTQRQALHNHAIIIILFIGLICDVTTYPWMLYFHRCQGLWERSITFCRVWGFIDWGLYITHTLLFAWTTIERHILVFHDAWLTTRKQRFFTHYLPLIALTLYCLGYYFIVYFTPPCTSLFDDTKMICYGSCLYYIYPLELWETIVHQILSVMTIIVSTIALLIRAIWQKCRIRQNTRWRKYRKMTLQLLSVSLLYLIFYFPMALIFTMVLCGLPPSDVVLDFVEYADFFSRFMLLLFPFVCVLSLPELQNRFINFLRC